MRVMSSVRAGALAACVLSCGRTEVEAAAASPLALEVEGSFREMGIRKTRIAGHVVGGPVEIQGIRTSDGIRLPGIQMPIAVRNRIILEIEWDGHTRSGKLFLQPTPPADEIVLEVVYDPSRRE